LKTTLKLETSVHEETPLKNDKTKISMVIPFTQKVEAGRL
jgi:hypothetical protein